MIILDLEV